jgi:hypothetical protein
MSNNSKKWYKSGEKLNSRVNVPGFSSLPTYAPLECDTLSR